MVLINLILIRCLDRAIFGRIIFCNFFLLIELYIQDALYFHVSRYTKSLKYMYIHIDGYIISMSCIYIYIYATSGEIHR